MRLRQTLLRLTTTGLTITGLAVAGFALAGAAIAQPPGGGDRFLERHDLDGDGVVTADEFGRSHPMFQKLDADANGIVDATEIAAGQQKMLLRAAGHLARRADADADGVVTASEWATWLESLDTDGDGILTAQEIVAQCGERPCGRFGRGRGFDGGPGGGPGSGDLDRPRRGRGPGAGAGADDRGEGAGRRAGRLRSGCRRPGDAGAGQENERWPPLCTARPRPEQQLAAVRSWPRGEPPGLATRPPSLALRCREATVRAASAPFHPVLSAKPNVNTSEGRWPGDAGSCGRARYAWWTDQMARASFHPALATKSVKLIWIPGTTLRRRESNSSNDREIAMHRPRHRPDLFASLLLASLVATLLAALLAGPAGAADWERARAAFEAGDHATAIDELIPLTDAQPEWWAGQLLLGRSLVAVGRASEGLERFERALELAPDRSDVRLVLARTALAEGRADRAAAVLRDEPTQGAQGALSLRLLATARLELEDPAGALAALRAGRAAHPDDATLASLEGRAARAAGDLEAAIAADADLVRLDADPVHRRRWASDLYELAAAETTPPEREKELCRRASAAMRPLLEGSPTSADLLLAGVVASCAAAHADAVTHLERARTQAPEDLRILGALASALNHAQRWGETIALLEGRLDGVGADADAGPLTLSLAVALEGAERYDEAIALYEQLHLPERLAEAHRRRELAERNRKLDELDRQETKLQDMLDDLESSTRAPVT
jgi:predicted Zn-dependent protease